MSPGGKARTQEPLVSPMLDASDGLAPAPDARSQAIREHLRRILGRIPPAPKPASVQVD